MVAQFDLSGDPLAFRDVLGRFLTHRYDHAVRNEIVESEAGWSPQIWNSLAQDLGVLGLFVSEEMGGLGQDPAMLIAIMEALGDALVVEPFLPTVIIAGGLLQQSRTLFASDLVRRIIQGDVRFAFAHIEPQARFAPNNVALIARQDGEEYVLDGSKSMVLAAPIATHLIVNARTSGQQKDREGISLFVVEADDPRIERRDFATIDGQRASELRFTGVRVPADRLLLEEGRALPAIEEILDVATVAICAEAVGIMRRLLRDTLTYTSERRQFGSALAEFQVLQHRMADMSASLELSSAMVFKAAHMLRADPASRGAWTSATKVYVCNAAQMVSQAAVQLHGAMGMTEEFPIGHRFKRVTAILSQFGSTEYHLSRFSRFEGSRLLFGHEDS